MDLEPQARRPAGERFLVVVGLEAAAGRQGVHGRALPSENAFRPSV
jgi:hypothetical protein